MCVSEAERAVGTLSVNFDDSQILETVLIRATARLLQIALGGS